MMKEKIFLYVNNTKTAAIPLSKKVKRSLISAGYDVIDDVKDKVDIVIGFGGDGTLISWLSNNNYTNNSKYIGINCGTLGFLQDFDVMDVKEFVDNIQNYVEEHLSFADIIINIDNNVYTYNALNEFVIKRLDDKALRVGVKVSDVLLENYVGTGLIFSTPTGSTARNLSSGGSIVCPGIDSIQMTPIEPNRFIGALDKSIIFPKEVSITLFSNSNEEVKVLSDGGEVYTGKFDKITISLSDKQLIKLVDKKVNFFKKVGKKLI